ncbi:MAG: serine protein kinase RIO [Thaumarchaeota archaeon]|nr:serine protein kinase RIO [Nitrososphaerota archaeon]
MLPEKIVDRFEHEIDKKLDTQSKHKIFNGFKNNKTINEVLDKTTIMTLYDLINKHIISYVNGVVRSGKESQLFWAVDKNGKDVALKIYLVSTSSFKKRASYILGDPRFSKVKTGTRNLVYLWAKKEFRNLTQCVEHNIPSTKPIYVTKNILVMEFVGKNGVPEKTLVETKVSQKDYELTISLIKRLYKEAKLVHGDLSEFNIFKTETGLILFDLASGVDIQHPNAQEFLKRDINNISKFFVKRGLTVVNPDDIFDLVTK